MPNTREKLIELLQDCIDEYVDPDDPYVGLNVEYGNFADHLIANGVTVQTPKGEKQPTDLTGKCGSCAYAKPTSEFNSPCYIYCSNRDIYRRNGTAYFKQRTTPACKLYKAKEGADNG